MRKTAKQKTLAAMQASDQWLLDKIHATEQELIALCIWESGDGKPLSGVSPYPKGAPAGTRPTPTNRHREDIVRELRHLYVMRDT